MSIFTIIAGKVGIKKGANTAEVKAASTAAVAADPALVVAVSPNNTVPVSGPLTDVQLRATSVPGSDGGGSLTVDGPLTDAQLRATAVPISFGGNVPAVDTTHSSLVVIDTAHYKVHESKHFFVENWTAVSGASSVFEILIKVPASKFPHMTYRVGADASFSFSLYEATAVSADGTAVTPRNNNRNSATASSVGVFTSPTVTSAGTALLGHLLSSSARSGGEGSRETELLLKANTNYLLRFTKTDSGVGDVSYSLAWYENV
mgnify:FL=1